MEKNMLFIQKSLGFEHLCAQDMCVVKGSKKYEHVLPCNHINIIKKKKKNSMKKIQRILI